MSERGWEIIEGEDRVISYRKTTNPCYRLTWRDGVDTFTQEHHMPQHEPCQLAAPSPSEESGE